MEEITDGISMGQMDMKEYRRHYRKKNDEFLKTVTRAELMSVVDVIVVPRVCLKYLRGNDKEMAEAIEHLYANDGRFLLAEHEYPPSMLDQFGKEYMLNAQGIYYRDRFSPAFVILDQKVWVPTFDNIDWDDESEFSRRIRARVLMRHNINNETYRKSEYAWEADAWADIFGEMRNDPVLEIDKREYSKNFQKTDPVSCKLTGELGFKTRIPDATFGFATFLEGQRHFPGWVDEFRRERLEKLLLHRKCGLIADPKWGKTDIVFPFMVYEAKGWSGDCRDARRQACYAAANYLDMLDNLARTPGPVESARNSLAFVSWLSAAEAKDEHEGVKGFSETVYVFQKVWSGRVINERTAWELLTLIDQIHLWAITEFRSFILDHLRPWHKFCEDNYLLDWDSIYDIGTKRRRTISDTEDLLMPSWVNLLNNNLQQKIQNKAKASLGKALTEHQQQKGKSKIVDPHIWHCVKDECARLEVGTLLSGEEFQEHLMNAHGIEGNDIASIRKCLDEFEMEPSDFYDTESDGDSGPGPSKRARLN